LTRAIVQVIKHAIKSQEEFVPAELVSIRVKERDFRWFLSEDLRLKDCIVEQKYKNNSTRKKSLRKPPQSGELFGKPEKREYLPLSAPAKKFRFERRIKASNQRIMAATQLPIETGHAVLNCPYPDYRK